MVNVYWLVVPKFSREFEDFHTKEMQELRYITLKFSREFRNSQMNGLLFACCLPSVTLYSSP